MAPVFFASAMQKKTGAILIGLWMAYAGAAYSVCGHSYNVPKCMS